jgi:hypothetical protein
MKTIKTIIECNNYVNVQHEILIENYLKSENPEFIEVEVDIASNNIQIKSYLHDDNVKDKVKNSLYKIYKL